MSKTATGDYSVAFLCLEVHCLPSELLREDYNTIRNIISILSARSERLKENERRSKEARRNNRF